MSKSKNTPGVRQLGQPNKFGIRATLVDPDTKQRKEIKRVISAATRHEALAAQEALRLELEHAVEMRRDTRRREVEAAAKAAHDAKFPTVGDYVAGWLLQKSKHPAEGARARKGRKKVRHGTLLRYAEHLAHFADQLGDVRMHDLTSAHVIDWLENLSTKLSPVTCINALRVVKTMTLDARAELNLPSWPCDRVVPPEPEEGYDEEAPNAFTPAELAQVESAMQTTAPRLWPLFAVMAQLGLRFCEAHALEWDDIDLDGRTVSIVRSRYKGETNKPKTKSSERTLPLDLDTGDFDLVSILRTQRAMLMRTQNAGLAKGLVFPTTTGTYQDNSRLNAAIAKATKVAKVEVHVTSHGLRRTANTVALDVLSIPVEHAIELFGQTDTNEGHHEGPESAGAAVREITGHTNRKMTSRYMALSLERKRSTLRRVRDVVRAARVEAQQAAACVEGRVEAGGAPVALALGSG